MSSSDGARRLAAAVAVVVGAAGVTFVMRRRRTRRARSPQPGDRSSAVGVVGLGVMGSQLTLNFAEKLRRSVSGFDMDEEKATAVLVKAREQGDLPVSTFTGVEDFVASLEVPRRIVLLVPAGKIVDAVIASLTPLLDAGDVIVDCGNEWYQLTEQRAHRVTPTGVHYVGCGLSGGGDGARRGPCLMPGGPPEAWQLLQPLLESIAARVQPAGGGPSYPCVRHIGPGGSGNYVKMVHNGIEYGDMQLIAEASMLVRELCGLTAREAADLFAEFDGGALSGFLMETAAAVHRKADDKPAAAAAVAGGAAPPPLMDALFDSCGSKGTGKWTIQQAAELGVPASTHAAALEARYLSSLKPQRLAAAAKAAARAGGTDSRVASAATPPATWRRDLEDALLASKLCSYAQGMAHLRAASDANEWDLRLSDLAEIWQGGCIIRAKVLNLVSTAFKRDPALESLLLDDDVAKEMHARLPGWRRFVVFATANAIPVPALSASLAYYDSFTTPLLRSAQCIQAQRDCFGGHGFKRLDLEGTFSAAWRA